VEINHVIRSFSAVQIYDLSYINLYISFSKNSCRPQQGDDSTSEITSGFADNESLGRYTILDISR